MKKFLPLLWLATGALTLVVHAQTATQPAAAPLAPPIANGPVPADIAPAPKDAPVTSTPLLDPKGKKVKVVAPRGLFEAPKATRPLKVAVYFGAGAGLGNSKLLVSASERIAGTQVSKLSPEDFATKDLSGFDVVVFAGGSGSGQAKALGEAGRENVKKYVKNGGSYLGICAGAYLACSNYPWSLGLMNARTLQPWARGGGAVALQLTGEGKTRFGAVEKPFPVRYNNGPVITRDNKRDAIAPGAEATNTDAPPDYTVLAYFRDELPKTGIPQGVMPGTPAILSSIYGKGKVVTISPHFEGTANMENFLPQVIAQLGEKPAIK